MVSLRVQVILVDHDRDPDLVRVDEQAAEAISSCCKDGPLACIQARHMLSTCIVTRKPGATGIWWLPAQKLQPLLQISAH